MQVIIMRGLPGSGKSSWIMNLMQVEMRTKSFSVCSADHSHMIDGKYEFKPENAAKAHLECKHKFLNALDRDVVKPEFLFVDNTNTTAWEIAWFWDTAAMFGCWPKIVRIHRSFEWCLGHNTHKVPDGTMWQMFQNIQNEKLPSWWKEEIYVSLNDAVKEGSCP